jgi:hypothetical protein
VRTRSSDNLCGKARVVQSAKCPKRSLPQLTGLYGQPALRSWRLLMGTPRILRREMDWKREAPARETGAKNGRRGCRGMSGPSVQFSSIRSSCRAALPLALPLATLCHPIIRNWVAFHATGGDDKAKNPIQINTPLPSPVLAGTLVTLCKTVYPGSIPGVASST